MWAKTQNTPAWIAEGKTAEELEQWMYDYVDRIADLYKDQLDYIDVLNEMISNSKNEVYADSPWLKIDDFACKLFKYTKKKLPKSVLLYNDDHFMSASGQQDKSQKVYAFIKSLVDGDCGIDGIGF